MGSPDGYPQRSGRGSPAQRNAPPEFEGESGVQAQPLVLLKNPWNLTGDQKERLSTLVRWNAPIVRAYYLKEAFQLFWDYKQPKRAKDHLEKWMRSAMSSRLEPFKKFVRLLRSHLDGILLWTRQRISNGAVEGMNNKIKSISHRSFGFRSANHFIAAIYHCCARLPLPVER
jgi:transposase